MSHANFKSIQTRTEAETFLRDHGITPTRQRIEVARTLFARPQHFSADQVAASLSSEGAAVSKATVYNTLGLFVQKGLVREIIADPERSFYDSNTTPHHHIFDLDSGEIEDLPGGDIRLAGIPELPPGARIEGVEVVIRIRRS